MLQFLTNVNNSLMMKVELSKRLIKIKYGNVFFSIGSFIYYKSQIWKRTHRERRYQMLSFQQLRQWQFNDHYYLVAWPVYFVHMFFLLFRITSLWPNRIPVHFQNFGLVGVRLLNIWTFGIFRKILLGLQWLVWYVYVCVYIVYVCMMFVCKYVCIWCK